ncbi:uncharacterized protein FRV6_16618 [Fusarium oxysporum]|uniref:Heterokaryon incompatibility domain-containing protein n=1 Tax=Fusarium oxysporum TaxID=5507 RepID=A0A2H3U6F9_FUSOX|nr:uncharacterized protein FRV6_16618 [Fusarium oxysporum]
MVGRARNDEEVNSERLPGPGWTEARYRYQESSDIKYTGKDILGRERTSPYDDRRIDFDTGKFVPLEVQSTSKVLNGYGGSTWKRREIKGIGPLTLVLTNWPFKTFEEWVELPKKDRPFRLFLDYFWKSVLLVPIMVFLGTFFRPATVEPEFNGRYTPVPYRYFGRAKKSRNPKDDTFAEDDHHNSADARSFEGPRLTVEALTSRGSENSFGDVSTKKSGRDRLERVLLPRMLCFVSQPPTREIDPDTGEDYLEFYATDVQQWMRKNKRNCPEYLFVAWSGKHFDNEDLKAIQKLHELARHATKEAGLKCYWLSLECISNESDAKTSLDIWRMSDVVRGCKELAVLLRSPADGEFVEDLLREWTQSIWTFPELLLSPGRHLTTYYYGPTPELPWVKEIVSKNQLAARCLSTDEDRYQVRRLLDHYLGNLKMSDLELMTVALHCFSSRVTRHQYLPGDYSYALMGLVGRRPRVSPTDSAFLAFARLSLENYNSRLFERFVCLLPAERNQPWHKIKDAYGAQLWDIEPSVQVAGIGVYKAGQEDPDDDMFEKEYFLTSATEEDDFRSVTSTAISSSTEMDNQVTSHGMATDMDDSKHQAIAKAESISNDSCAGGNQATHDHWELRDDDVVILDGCRGATVHWDRFRSVWYPKRISTKRQLLRWLLRLNFIPLIIGLVLVALADQNQGFTWTITGGYQSRDDNSMVGAGAFFLIYSLSVYIAAPWIIQTVYGGKFWHTQPFFFGFEGYVPIGDIEAKIFGTSKGRLTWSHYASSPLSHHVIKDERWVVSRDPLQNPKTKHLVESAAHAKPGESRVFTIVDTYSMTATLFEANRPPEVLLVCGSEGETVLRLETRSLERMDRIRRVRLGMKRIEKDTVAICSVLA